MAEEQATSKAKAGVSFVIRDARPDDAAVIAELTRRLMPVPETGRDLSVYAAYFARPTDYPAGTRTIVACGPDDVALGYLTVRPETEYFSGVERAYVERIAVADVAEGSGVGRALLDWAAAWARSQGYATIALDVFASNERARRFYLRNGYVDDFVRMVRPLGPEDESLSGTR